MITNKQKIIRSLSVFSLIMITVGSVDSIRNLPATALFGTSLIFFFTAAAMMFLIPCALVSAELASTWSEDSGVYTWVKKAFGPQFGFLAIWFQWVENIFWYPTILSFVAGTVGYLVSPTLAENKYFLIAIILSAFWIATFINLKGMESSARFSNFCGIVGLFIPMSLIIFLGFSWMTAGHPLQIELSKKALLPHFSDKNVWVSLTGIILSFCGMEIATVHAREVHRPQKAFPVALAYAATIILLTLLFGSLAIAIVIPAQKISLVAGIMQAFEAFFMAYHMQWILPFIALMLVIGAMGGVSNWIIAPVKGLMIAAHDGNLPVIFRKENRHGAPKVILITQAMIVSCLSLVFLLMPSVNGSYWLLTALASQLYMMMYILMFSAAIYLRFKYPEQPSVFQIPGGRLGLCFIAIIGIIGSTIALCVGFIPPGNINVGSSTHYEMMLLFGLLLVSIPPILLYRYRKDIIHKKMDLMTSVDSMNR